MPSVSPKVTAPGLWSHLLLQWLVVTPDSCSSQGATFPVCSTFGTQSPHILNPLGQALFPNQAQLATSLHPTRGG